MRYPHSLIPLSVMVWTWCALGLNGQEMPVVQQTRVVQETRVAQRTRVAQETRVAPKARVAQEAWGPYPSSAAARTSKAVKYAAGWLRAPTGVRTGYRGHFACRFFTGNERELAIAVSDQQRETVTQLLESGANIDARSVASHAHGMTLLQTAVLHGWGLESIGLLLEAGADVNARDRRGDSALTVACRNPLASSVPVVERLIEAGAAVDGPGARGMTPLMCAALHDDTGLVVKSLLQASAGVAARDKMGWTALMHATRRRHEHIEIVQILVQAGSPINARHLGGGLRYPMLPTMGSCRPSGY